MSESHSEKHCNSALRSVIIGMVITVMLLVGKRWFEGSTWGHGYELWAYEKLHTPLSPLNPNEPPPVTVIDIHDIPGSKDTVTDRRALEDLIVAIAKHNPAAIAVDVNFSRKGLDWNTDLDPHFFRRCLQIRKSGVSGNRADEAVPIFLGIDQSIYQDPPAWLGDEDFIPLATAIEKIRHDPRYMPRWIWLKGKERQKLPSISQALAGEYLKKHNVKPPVPPWWLIWLCEREKDYSSNPLIDLIPGKEDKEDEKVDVIKSLVNYSKLSAINFTKEPPLSQKGIDKIAEKLSDKMVLIGDVEDAQDLSSVPGYEDLMSGALLQACAAYTFVKEPLYEFCPVARFGIDLILSVILFSLFARLSNVEMSLRSQKRRRALFWSVLAVLSFGFFGVLWWHIMWLDFIAVALALILHFFGEKHLEEFGDKTGLLGFSENLLSPFWKAGEKKTNNIRAWWKEKSTVVDAIDNCDSAKSNLKKKDKP